MTMTTPTTPGTDAIHHDQATGIAEHRKQLAPGIHDAFHDIEGHTSALALEAAGHADHRQSA